MHASSHSFAIAKHHNNCFGQSRKTKCQTCYHKLHNNARHSNLQTKLPWHCVFVKEVPRVQNKFWELALIFLKVYKLVFWKIAISKPFEQMLSKLFYLATPIFVVLLHIMGKLHEFSHIFLEYISASFKSPKCCCVKRF